MGFIKHILTGIVIGAVIGLWFGYNLGRERPIFSNPFADSRLQERAKDTAEESVRDTKRALREQLSD